MRTCLGCSECADFEFVGPLRPECDEYTLVGYDEDEQGQYAIFRNVQAWPDYPDVTVAINSAVLV